MSQNTDIKYLTPIAVDVKKKKFCRFKKHGIKYIDYKDEQYLMRFINDQENIAKTPYGLLKISKVAQAIKEEHIAILPFVADNLKKK